MASDAKIALADPPSKPAPGGGHGRRWLWAGAGLVAGLLVAGLGIALPLGLAARRSRGSVLLAAERGAAGEGVRGGGTTRRYYIAAEPVEWDYAPAGRNLCSGKPFSGPAELYTTASGGTKFRKAVYREYTDDTFATPKQRGDEHVHLGLLGPPIHAEVGDTVEVVLRNKLGFPVNIAAGGVQAGGPMAANPGDTVTSRWLVPEAAAPPEGGPSSALYLYRSTVDATRDTQAGLAGPLVVARRGGLRADGSAPADVDRELFLMLQVFDESGSPFAEHNAAATPRAAALAELGEADAAEALRKYSVNGFLFCNLPGLNMTAGERVRWYVSSLGSEDAIHTAHWHGITFLTAEGRHMDQVVVQASTAAVLDAFADNPGTWLFHCHLTDHIHGGMMALFTVGGAAPQPKLGGKTRQYYIAAVEEVWDYVPFGGEMCGGTRVNFSDNAKTFVAPGKDRIGSRYLKARYVEFTDESFTQKKRRAPEWEHLGLLGPVIRGVVGDTILVTFKNSLERHPVSIHAHGVLYDKESEGSPYADGMPVAPADKVAPGQVVTYKWLVPERAGPGPSDLSSVMWMYHSHVDESADPAAGLVGPIVITAAGAAGEGGEPNDVDREFVLSFSIMDEGASILAEDNMARFLPRALAANESALAELAADPGFQESNLMHSINGFMYCNLPGLDFTQGSTARLYLMALGSSADMHTPNSAEGQLFIDGHRRQAVALLPGAMMAVDTTPWVPGKGLLQCHVYDHISAGMSAIYDVKNLKILDSPANATVRTYYIAAEPVEWDYAPLGFDGCTGQPWSDAQRTFVKTTNGTLGSKYKKALFREYTDATFTERRPSPPEHGILGPVLRAEVGDKLVVHFLNRLPFNASVQVFGGLAPVANTTAYQVGLSDGEAEAAVPAAAPAAAAPAAAPAPAGRRLLSSAAGRRRLRQITAAQAEAEAVVAQSVENLYALGGVAPGGAARYEWVVPDSAGPASRDGASVVYSYVSGVDHIKHINAGLVGPLVVYRRGRLADPGVDREVPVLFNIQNEMQSALYNESLAAAQKAARVKVDTAALTFPESNLMHQVNGYVYCNGPTLQLRRGERVRWLVMGFGSEADMHSPVFEGQEVAYGGRPVFSVGLMPSNTLALDMTAASSGQWSYYCDVLDHISAGMRARMVVS